MEKTIELIELEDGSSNVLILTQTSCGTIIFIFDSYFDNLELLNVTFIFITALSVSI
jgi:hypothetical protein